MLVKVCNIIMLILRIFIELRKDDFQRHR